MGEKQNIYVIACGVLAQDILNVAKNKNLHIKTKFLPGGLHNRPEELRQRVQHAIDKKANDLSLDRIIIGYGLCGRGTVDIQARRVPLVIPKVHDCIALFLGSNQAYREEFQRFPGTFYISGGWYHENIASRPLCSEKIWVGDKSIETSDIKKKFGKKGGRSIIDFFTAWHKNYQRAAFIDTGLNEASIHEDHAKRMARKYGWKFERLKGNLSLLTRLLISREPSDDIIVVPPGYSTLYSPIENGLTCLPPSEAIKGYRPKEVVSYLEKKGQNFIKGKKTGMGLGVDAGGTYTDVVIHDFSSGRIKGKNKALTTKWDFSQGIDQALSGLNPEDLSKVELVSISTTLATNAIVEEQGQKVGLILMNNGDYDKKEFQGIVCAYVKGRIDISGREVEPVIPDEIKSVAKNMIEKHEVTAFAVSGYAGSINPAHEKEVKKILEKKTSFVVSCGHELSDLLNFVVRAKTAVLNARIIPKMIKFFKELDKVLIKRSITAPVMVVKGNGTLISASMAMKRPVETVLSGPAASVAGAKYLTGLQNALVVDMGGTTTDIANLEKGMVRICKEGARIGRYKTHAKALAMRTIGLGGDSHIKWHKDSFRIGPCRVAPVVWADASFKSGVENCLAYMEIKVKSSRALNLSQSILVTMNNDLSFEPTRLEEKIFHLLRISPMTPGQVAEKLGALSYTFLPFSRLEESGVVQRCGLTPTDLIHITGAYDRYDAGAAKRLLHIMAQVSRRSFEELLSFLLSKVEESLSLEMLKKALSQDINLDMIDDCPVCSHLVHSMLADRNSNYSIEAKLSNPVVCIGAPVHYFLPRACGLINAEAIIPDDADVANAIGAITSHVMIIKKANVRPDQSGGFIVEGIEDSPRFTDLNKAEKWTVNQLKALVIKEGATAGTVNCVVKSKIKDTAIDTANGLTVFMGRSIKVTLTGNPEAGQNLKELK